MCCHLTAVCDGVCLIKLPFSLCVCARARVCVELPVNQWRISFYFSLLYQRHCKLESLAYLLTGSFLATRAYSEKVFRCRIEPGMIGALYRLVTVLVVIFWASGSLFQHFRLFQDIKHCVHCSMDLFVFYVRLVLDNALYQTMRVYMCVFRCVCVCVCAPYSATQYTSRRGYLSRLCCGSQWGRINPWFWKTIVI